MIEAILNIAQPIATIVAAFIAAFLGSWMAGAIAWQRFRKEKAFDRQLDWYERMIRSLHHLAQQIEVARTFQEEEGTEPVRLQRFWGDVQKAHLVVDLTALEAPLYASVTAIRVARRIAKNVQNVANETDAFSFAGLDATKMRERLERIDSLVNRMYKMARLLAVQGRVHLKIPEAPRMARGKN